MRDGKAGSFCVGRFEVKEGGQIGAWDPCYGDGQKWPAAPGTWEAWVDKSDEGSWGVRVKELRAFRVGRDPAHCYELADDLGVDSGQMGIYALNPGEEIDTSEADYEKICDLTLSDGQFGVLPYGVVSSSGFGDGGYDARGLKDEQGRLTEIRIEFIPDEKLSEDDYYGEGHCNDCGREAENLFDGRCGECDDIHREELDDSEADEEDE